MPAKRRASARRYSRSGSGSACRRCYRCSSVLCLPPHHDDFFTPGTCPCDESMRKQMADAELPHVRARPSAEVAAIVLRDSVLVFAESAIYGRLLSHSVSTSLPEGEPELRQQRARLVVGARGGDEGDLETPQFIDLVVLDLRENQLLAQPERVVTVP